MQTDTPTTIPLLRLGEYWGRGSGKILRTRKPGVGWETASSIYHRKVTSTKSQYYGCLKQTYITAMPGDI